MLPEKGQAIIHEGMECLLNKQGMTERRDHNKNPNTVAARLAFFFLSISRQEPLKVCANGDANPQGKLCLFTPFLTVR